MSSHQLKYSTRPYVKNTRVRTHVLRAGQVKKIKVLTKCIGSWVSPNTFAARAILEWANRFIPLPSRVRGVSQAFLLISKDSRKRLAAVFLTDCSRRGNEERRVLCR